MIDLLFEVGDSWTPELVAERAGVSTASLFRYFENLDELRSQAVGRYFERYSDLFEIPAIGTGSRADRIRTVVRARVVQHRTTDPVARNVRSSARQSTVIGEALARLRATQIDQLRVHFADELAALTPAVRDDLVATIGIATSYESWEQFRTVSGRSDTQIRRAWADALDRLLP